MVAPDLKFAPLTWSVNVVLSCNALLGESDVIWTVDPVIVNVAALLVPPVSVTVTEAVPAFAISLDVIEARTRPEFT